MKNRQKLLLWPALFMLVLLATPAAAKGPVDRITIEGPGLQAPVQLADDATLSQFDPWSGQFFDPGGALAAVPKVGEPYLVRFFMERPGKEPKLIYIFTYYFNREGGRGYIYLPGPGDDFFETNKGTIIRNQDGRWMNATASWDRVMDLAVSTRPTASLQTSSTLIPWVVYGLGALVFITGTYAHRRRLRGIGRIRPSV